MSLLKKYRNTFLPSEVEFLVEDQPILIIPRYALKDRQLIGTSIPVLKPMKRAEVPLWLGFILKQQDRCNIVTPSWLSINFLKKAYQEEVTYTTRFFRMPWNWLEISKMILDKASDDMTEPPHQIRALIQDLREVRLIKARRGLKELNESYMQLDNLSLMEINELRPLVVGVMDQLRKLQVGTNEDEEVSDEEGPLSYDI
ncbi:hypothetical protein LJB42_002193 [Komagataella kurtzmanii]|nr:hypothetical protein LJB42_002193 [Komagataella kurtzmanii]